MITMTDDTTTWDAAAMLDALPERVNRYRISDRAITYCNKAWAAQYNVEPEDAIGRPLDQFLCDDELAGMHSQLALLGPDRPLLVDKHERAVPNAPGLWLEWVDRYLPGPNGAEVLSIGRDVTARHVAQQQLADSEARFRALADESSDVVWHFVVAPTPHFDYISPSIENLLGYPPEYFRADYHRLLDLLVGDGGLVISRALKGEQLPDRFDLHFRHANGSIIVGETRSTAVRDGMQGVSRDVTELRVLQERLAAMALRDPLTGLANRRLFDELLEAGLARTHRSGTPLGITYIDVDNLKQVNDTYGHDAGDLVLCETARRLVSIVNGADVVARLGGDEFAIVYEPNDPSSANLIERIDEALSRPIYITGTISVRCSASIGCADTSTAGRKPSDLIGAADHAMYQTKRLRQTVRRA
jgi:diguanylate cyclase (GGDEF)-like protein/PAS domain S-box-containing protein